MTIRLLRLSILAILLSAISCTFTQKIKDGEMAFDRKQYAVAVKMLTDEFERTEYPELKARKAFLIAESYKEINKVSESIEWYKSAFDLRYGDKALEQLGYALKKNEQYKEAISVFRAVEERVGQSAAVTKEISECTMAANWYDEVEKSPYVLEPIAQNSIYSDYAPAIFEANQLVFTSDRKGMKNEDQYKWTGHWYSDLYIINQFSNEVIPFDGNINSEHNDGSVCFNSDFTEVYFTRCHSDFDDDYCKLMMSKRINGGWTDPEYLPFMEDRINYAHPSLHSSDSILFFVANIESGFGGHDIYYVERYRDGWGKPQVLGSGINTIGDELFPFIYEDTLYFSSNGWPGMGGLDIFKTYVKEDGNWASITNLKPPINSGSDDFGLVINIEKRKSTGELTGFLTSSRKGSQSDDIYAFRSRIIDDPVEEIAEESEDSEEVKLYLAIQTKERSYMVENDPASGITGARSLPNVKIEVESGNEIKSYSSGNNGLLVLNIEPGDRLSIKSAKTEYLSSIVEFNPTNIPDKGEKTYNITVTLEKIFKDFEIVLDNIYYDYDESYIRDDAKPSLNALSKLLKDNPEIEIELISHTDCRGTDEYNFNLSQARAQAAVDYLKSVGIRESRVSATGLGKTRPAINCYCETCSEAEHQQNRRTSFKIVEY